MAGTSARSVDSLRRDARRLLKQLRGQDAAQVEQAAARLARLRSFAHRTVAELASARDEVRLKHALALVALENGHDSWPALKAQLETLPRKASDDGGQAPPGSAEPVEGTLMYVRGLDLLLNRWFAHYEAARTSLEQLGGYLPPYQRQFFICESEAIRLLGLDPDDPGYGEKWCELRSPEGVSIALDGYGPELLESPVPYLSLEVDDLSAEVERLRVADVTFAMPLQINRSAEGREICRMAVILDPDGNPVMLHQKAAWRDEPQGAAG